jgi:hypothetical protein
MLRKKYINLKNIIWYVITVIVKIIAGKEGEKKMAESIPKTPVWTKNKASELF